MKLSLTHTLTLELTSPSRAVAHLLLSAQATPQQKIERWSIDMPGLAEGAAFRDGFGNRANLVSLVKPGDSLTITVSGAVETIDKAGVLGRLTYDPPTALYLRPTELTKPDPALIEGIGDSGGRIAVMHELMGRVFERTSPSQAQSEGTQSQSAGEHHPVALAHAFIAGARALDIPARLVTGYLWEEGTASLHAWAEAWDEGLGWIGFDPLLNLCPTDTHIRLAAGLDATGATPVRMVPAPAGETTHVVEIVEG
jgi:transglutaminase-like putative cysteine protease